MKKTTRAALVRVRALLEPRRLDGEAIAQALEGQGAPLTLLVAIAYARRGELQAAKRYVRAALESPVATTAEDSLVRLVAGLVSFVTEEHRLSLELLRSAAELAPSSRGRLLYLAQERASFLGWDDDQLEILQLATEHGVATPRAHLLAAQVHARRRQWAAALERVDQALVSYPNFASPLMERARLCLELGDGDACLASLDQALTTEGRAYAFQMEAAGLTRRLGRLDRAQHHLLRAQEVEGTSLAPRVALAELSALRGELEQAAAQARECLASDPSCADAQRVLDALNDSRGDIERLRARLIGAAPREPSGALAPRGSGGQRAKSALSGAPAAPWDAAQELERAHSLLGVGMGWDVLRTSRGEGSWGVSAPREAPRRSLSEAEIAAFVRDGYVRVSGCFDEAFARVVRAEVEARVQQSPARWVKHAERGAPARFTSEDPSTWTMPIMIIDGARTFSLPDRFPRAWGAICELLGGPERVASRQITDYMNLNLCAGREDGFKPPTLASSAWHVDDPSSLSDLRGIVNGLVLIVLFDRVAAGAGGTLVLPGSVADVVHFLVESEPGRDLTQPEVRQELAARSSQVVELTGEVGDFFLLHPLLLHSAAPNPSGRIRWMANPTLYLKQPLRARPATGYEPSPVELAVWRALEPPGGALSRADQVHSNGRSQPLSFIEAAAVTRSSC
ncbi:MAG: phytanoyl-CoA dioxygenase family protein [Polyangiaceae bacterium]|nr:phytanoyl-CoA dioxygenase family protein [Polyangiaceae bacterium]MCW5789685.1 phytanoyl-CoA dioxygenase family protein [Polyangiaceae bacterium]